MGIEYKGNMLVCGSSSLLTQSSMFHMEVHMRECLRMSIVKSKI
jgi:hypothetical protein